MKEYLGALILFFKTVKFGTFWSLFFKECGWFFGLLVLLFSRMWKNIPLCVALDTVWKDLEAWTLIMMYFEKVCKSFLKNSVRTFFEPLVSFFKNEKNSHASGIFFYEKESWKNIWETQSYFLKLGNLGTFEIFFLKSADDSLSSWSSFFQECERIFPCVSILMLFFLQCERNLGLLGSFFKCNWIFGCLVFTCVSFLKQSEKILKASEIWFWCALKKSVSLLLSVC